MERIAALVEQRFLSAEDSRPSQPQPQNEQAGPLGSRLQAIQALAEHTVRYTELAPTRFKDFWRV